jgi:hypothetical protein
MRGQKKEREGEGGFIRGVLNLNFQKRWRVWSSRSNNQHHRAGRWEAEGGDWWLMMMTLQRS